MKSNSTFCCGKVGPKRIIEKAKIPANPVLINGTTLIYLGAGIAKITGITSGLTYFVSDHRRQFIVENSDVDRILQKSEIILKP